MDLKHLILPKYIFAGYNYLPIYLYSTQFYVTWGWDYSIEKQNQKVNQEKVSGFKMSPFSGICQWTVF